MEAEKTTGNDWFAVEVRVRYQETDAMGVVYHGNYLTWFEIARTEWTRARGVPYGEAERRGLYLPVVDAEVHYKQPAKYDDVLEVRCRPTEVGSVRLSFAYEIRDKAAPERLLVTGATRHVWVDRAWKPIRLAKAAPDVYEMLRSAAFGEGE